MEDTQKTLEQFCQWVTEEIDSGRARLDDLLARATYTPIQEYFSQHTEDLTELFVIPEKESLQRLRALFSNPRVFIPAPPSGAETLTQFTPYEETTMTSLPTESVSPARIQVVEQTHKTVSDINKEQVAFIRKLVPKFVENLRAKRREAAGQEQNIPGAQMEQIKQIVEENLSKPLSPMPEAEAQPAIVDRVARSVEKIQDLAPYKPAIVESVKDFIARPDIAKRLSTNTETKTARATILDRSVTSPEVFARAVGNGLGEEQAVHLTRTYDVIAQARTQPDSVDSFGKPATEIITKAFPGLTKSAAQSAFTQAWERVTSADSFIDNMTKRLGESIVSSEQFQQFILEGNKYISQQKPSSGTGLMKEFSAAPAITDPEMQDYIAALYQRERNRAIAVELSQKSVGGASSPPSTGTAATSTAAATVVVPLHHGLVIGHFPSFIEFYIAKIRVNQPQAITTTSSGLLQWGAQIGLEKAAKATLGTGAKVAAEKVGLSLGIKGLGAAVGGLPGWIIAVAGTKLLEWGGKIVSGAIQVGGYILSGGTISTILQGKPASLTDTLVLFPVILIAALVLLFAIPILPFINFADFPQTNRNVALVTSMQDAGGGIGPSQTGTPIDCTKPPDQGSPACVLTQCEGDCQWPLDSSSGACIIEGPFVGTHSDCRLSGIDFISLGGQDKLFGATVYTPYAGTVERAVFGYLDNSGYEGNQDGGTYGNHVIVSTDNGGHLLFAHLRNIQLVQQGQRVAAKTPVGFVDHTGFSLGVHLHYEDWGVGCPRPGVDINKYTPFPIPPCTSYADCEAKLQSAGHAACL